MSEINYADLVDGTQLPAQLLYDGIFTGFATINGDLDSANLDAIATDLGTGVNFYSIQKHAVSAAGGVGATGNLDFFGGVSNTVDGWYLGVGTPEEANKRRFLSVPGASVQFYVPFPAIVLLTWEVQWTNDSDGLLATGEKAPDQGSVIRLFVDNTKHTSTHARKVDRTMFRALTGEDKYLRDRYKGRYWCGHALVKDLNKGYHSASLRLCAEQNIKQTRVRARSMKYIIFRRGDS
jgi:hypothetical protein